MPIRFIPRCDVLTNFLAFFFFCEKDRISSTSVPVHSAAIEAYSKPTCLSWPISVYLSVTFCSVSVWLAVLFTSLVCPPVSQSVVRCFVCLSVSQSVFLCWNICITLSWCLPVYVSVCLSLNVWFYLSEPIWKSVCLSVRPPLIVSLFMSVCLMNSLPLGWQCQTGHVASSTGSVHYRWPLSSSFGSQEF